MKDTKIFLKNKKKKIKKARDRYKNLSEEKIEKKHLYHRDRNKNLSEEKNKRKLSIWDIIIWHRKNHF